MTRLFIFAAALVFAGPALADSTAVTFGLQTGSEPRTLGVFDTSTTRGLVPVGVVGKGTHKFSPLYPIDLRVYGAVCNGASSTGVATAVAAAVADGYKAVFLPKNCTYIPAGNITPANLDIFGEDWNTSVISSADRTTDYVAIGAHSKVYNVAWISKFCDDATAPVFTPKTCPIAQTVNEGNASSLIAGWPYTTLFVRLGESTNPGGTTATDVPGVQIVNDAAGDSYFASTTSTAASFRIWPIGTGDVGLLVQPGVENPGNVHTGIEVDEEGTNVLSASVLLRRDHDVTSLLITDANEGSALSATSPLVINALHQASGGIITVYNNANATAPDIINLNMADGSGTFSGNYLLFKNNNATEFKVDSAGMATSAGGLALLPQTAPGNPSTGWVIYTDSGDGNKLKAKASTGTTVTLGTP